MKLTFHGVRGSTPSPCDQNRRYGGNTSSVAVQIDDESPILLDLGTGARQMGMEMCEPFVGSILVTHLHWDHIQGLPFFGPMLRPGAAVKLYGPIQAQGSLREALDVFVQPPLFPVMISDLPCDFEAIGVDDEQFVVGSASVTSRTVPHVGETVGYRITHGARSVTYIPDHQQPLDTSTIDANVAELCDGVDVLIHDAQYTPEEFEQKSTWGHCTIDYSVHVAAACGVKKLVLFHHDPAHNDDWLDELTAAAAVRGAERGVEVIAAHEGLSLEV